MTFSPTMAKAPVVATLRIIMVCRCQMMPTVRVAMSVSLLDIVEVMDSLDHGNVMSNDIDTAHTIKARAAMGIRHKETWLC